MGRGVTYAWYWQPWAGDNVLEWWRRTYALAGLGGRCGPEEEFGVGESLAFEGTEAKERIDMCMGLRGMCDTGTGIRLRLVRYERCEQND